MTSIAYYIDDIAPKDSFPMEESDEWPTERSPFCIDYEYKIKNREVGEVPDVSTALNAVDSALILLDTSK